MTTKYRVHIYTVVRVPFEVEAQDQAGAIEAARNLLEPTSFRSRDAEDAEEVVGFLVDEDGDEEYSLSRSYDADGVADTARKAA